jgi:hypothetical protein
MALLLTVRISLQGHEHDIFEKNTCLIIYIVLCTLYETLYSVGTSISLPIPCGVCMYSHSFMCHHCVACQRASSIMPIPNAVNVMPPCKCQENPKLQVAMPHRKASSTCTTKIILRKLLSYSCPFSHPRRFGHQRKVHNCSKRCVASRP